MPKPSMAASAGRSQAFWQASAPALCRPAAGRLPIPARPFGFIVGRPAVVQANRKMLSAICDLSLSGQEPQWRPVIGVGMDSAPRSTRDIWAWRSSVGIPCPVMFVLATMLLIMTSMPTGTAVLRKLEHRMLSRRCGRPAHARQMFEHRIKSGCH